MKVFDVVVVLENENGVAEKIVFDERILAASEGKARAVALVQASVDSDDDGSNLVVFVRPFA